MNKPKPINALLQKQNSQLNKLQHHINSLQQFEKRLRELLPNQLSKSLLWQIGNLENHVLTLVIEHAAWATRLRFMQKEILRHAQRLVPAITQIQLKVRRQHANRQESAPNRPRGLSPHVAKQIKEFADCVSDPQLRSALKRLGRHQRK